MENVKKNDFIELEYTGYSGEEVFDSNIEEEIKKLNKNAKPGQKIFCVGEGMLVKGLDNALEGKKLGHEEIVELTPKDAFGDRDRKLVKTIPLKVFYSQKIDPKPGMVFAMDNSIAKILAVSGARVITDFNNPLAGKVVKYKFKIIRKIDDDKEKANSLFDFYFRFIPEFEVGEKITVKGRKELKIFVDAFKDKFKSLIGKELDFEEKVEKKEDKQEDKK